MTNTISAQPAANQLFMVSAIDKSIQWHMDIDLSQESSEGGTDDEGAGQDGTDLGQVVGSILDRNDISNISLSDSGTSTEKARQASEHDEEDHGGSKGLNQRT